MKYRLSTLFLITVIICLLCVIYKRFEIPPVTFQAKGITETKSGKLIHFDLWVYAEPDPTRQGFYVAKKWSKNPFNAQRSSPECHYRTWYPMNFQLSGDDRSFVYICYQHDKVWRDGIPSEEQLTRKWLGMPEE